MLALVVDDLLAEEAALDALLAPLRPDQWDLPTPAAGWAVRDQVTHLAIAEDLATLAATDPDAFVAHLTALMSDLAAVEEDHAAQARAHSPDDLLSWWRRAARATVAAIRDRAEGERIAWITGPMSATSFATARLMSAASCPVNHRPVSSSSIDRDTPTRRGSNHVEFASGMTLSRTKGKRSRASSATMRMSARNVVVSPAPIAMPLIAAIIGVRIVQKE